MGNRDANIQLGGYGFGEGHLFGAVTSFGSATVAVGRTRFRSYAKSFLMRNLYDFHWKGARDIARRVLSASDATKPDNVINELLAAHFYPKYLEETGLRQTFDRGLATSGVTDVVLSQKHSETTGREFERLLWDRLPASEHNSAGWREHLSNFGTLLRPDQLRKANTEFEERLKCVEQRTCGQGAAAHQPVDRRGVTPGGYQGGRQDDCRAAAVLEPVPPGGRDGPRPCGDFRG
jgi:hypothetical protein